MDRESKCPHCGNQLKEIVVGSAKNFRCECCGFSNATTIAEGIEWDSKDYLIRIENNNEASINQIKTISSLSSLNFIESKKLLLDGGILTKGRALLIKGIILKLNREKIKFKVTPEFSYD